MTLAFFTESKIGFTKIFDKSLAPSFCESGTAKFVDLTVDANAGTFYGATNRGEVMVFEASNRADAIECKVRAVLKVGDDPQMKLASTQGLLFAATNDAALHLYKTDDWANAQAAVYRPPLLEGQTETQVEVLLSAKFNFLLSRLPSTSDGTARLLVIESFFNPRK